MLTDKYIQEMSQLMLDEWRALKRTQPESTDAQTRQRLKDGAAQYLITVKLQGSSLPDELVLLLCEMLDDPTRNDIQLEDESNDEPELQRINSRLFMIMLGRAMGVRSSSVWPLSRAILCERQHAPDPMGENPSSASVNKVAREAQVTPATIRRWRQLKFYREMIGSAPGRGVGTPSRSER